MEKDLVLDEFFSSVKKNYNLDSIASVNNVYDDLFAFYIEHSMVDKESVKKAVYDLPLSYINRMLTPAQVTECMNVSTMSEVEVVPRPKVKVKKNVMVKNAESKISGYDKLQHHKVVTKRVIGTKDFTKITDDEVLVGQFEQPEDPKNWVAAHVPGDKGVRVVWFNIDYKTVNQPHVRKVLKVSYSKMIADDFVEAVSTRLMSFCNGQFYLDRYKKQC